MTSSISFFKDDTNHTYSSTAPVFNSNFTQNQIPKPKLNGAQLKHYHNFLSVLKMKERGETCKSCADPDPYKYVLSKQLCGRCWHSFSKKGEFPIEPGKKKRYNKQIQAVEAFLKTEEGISQDTERPFEYLNNELNKRIKYAKSLSDLQKSSTPLYVPEETISDTLNEEDTNYHITSRSENLNLKTALGRECQMQSFDLYDFTEKEPLFCFNKSTITEPDFFRDDFLADKNKPTSPFRISHNVFHEKIPYEKVNNLFNAQNHSSSTVERTHEAAINCINPSCSNPDPNEGIFHNGLCLSCYAFKGTNTEKLETSDQTAEDILAAPSNSLQDSIQDPKEGTFVETFSNYWQSDLPPAVPDFNFLLYLSTVSNPVCLNEDPGANEPFVNFQEGFLFAPTHPEGQKEETPEDKEPTNRPTKKLRGSVEDCPSEKTSDYKKQADRSIERMHELGLKCINESCKHKNPKVYIFASNLCIQCHRRKKKQLKVRVEGVGN